MEKTDGKNWTTHFRNRKMTYPAEYLIRILKGAYPNLKLSKEEFHGKKACDLGCGNGRHVVLLDECGFDAYGMEISQDLINVINHNLEQISVKADIRLGVNTKIPYENAFFDYLLSWNECYYMGNVMNFEKVLDEFARILKKNGILILSIPKKSNGIFDDCENLGNGYAIIRSDPAKFRNGTIFRIFEDDNDIENTFSQYFEDFVFGSMHDNCFGYNFHWYLVV